MRFYAYGHENITSTHKNTLEITKDKDISKAADCIIGVNSDFDAEKIAEFIKSKEKLKIKIKAGEIDDEVNCLPNPEFCDKKEIVVRIGEFCSKRTLGTRADKPARQLKRELVEKLKKPGQKVEIEII